ncbi:MAG: DUF1501 domain-containing protein [Planctomycetes bacterium]|nr:DUF1501 domain-containing protein [Planctomycetota bacterium]
MSGGFSMATTRRGFLVQALGAAATLPLLPRFAFARAALAAARPDRIVVLLDLAGGNDGLNTVVPHSDPLYLAARPTLRIEAAGLLPLADGLGLRSELAPLHRRFEAGELAIVQGVGYPNPDLSHFKSTDIWHSASLTPTEYSPGWIARVADRPEFAGSGRLPLIMCGGGPVPRAIVGSRGPAPQVDRIDQLRPAAGPEAGAAARVAEQKAIAEAISTSGGSGGAALAFLRDAARATQRQAVQIEQAASKGRASGDYPAAPLGGALRLAAQLIGGGLDGSAYYVRQDGYDTHAFQRDQHALLLRDLGQALGAFWDDVVAAGAADRVVVLAWSEFGRRVAENGSKGTDHGAAAPLFVLGKGVRGGLHGAAPRLDALIDKNLVHTTDFRRVYAALLDDWLEVDSTELLGERFEPVPVIRRSS